MARQVLPIVGAVVGAFFGNPQLGYAIGAIIGNAVDPQVIKTPGIKELPTQTAGEGAYRQVVYGTCWVNQTNIIDFGEVRRVTRRERQGKGGGPVVESERLYRTYAIGLGEPFDAVRVIRRNGKIVYDVRPGSTMLDESAEFAERFTFYSGAEDQLPDPDLEALTHNGVGNTPSYRGTAYIVFPNDDLTDQQGMIPTYEVEASNVGPAVTSWGMVYGNATAIFSPDGLDWSAVAGPSDFSPIGALWAIAGNGLFVVYDGGQSAVTSDGGTTWTLSAVSALGGSGGTRYGCYFASNQKFYVAGGFNGIYESSNGSAWTLRNSGINSYAVGAAATWMISMRGGASPTIQVSNDGVTWTDGTDPPVFPDANEARFASNGTKILVANVSSFDSRTLLSTTTDGSTWTANQTPFALNNTQATACAFDEVNEMWVVGAATGEIAYSATGESGWVLSATNVGVRINDIQCSGGVCVLVGNGGEIFTSEDGGVTWTDRGPTDAGAVNLLAVDTASAIIPEPGDPITLSSVMDDICDRCGLSAGEYSFSDLSSYTMLGVTLGGPYDGASAAALFFAPYSFDLAQPDKVIIPVIRGGAAADTFTSADFIEGPDESILRGQDIEYPRALMLKYLDAEQNYAAPAATVQRTTPDSRVSGEATMELPISLSRDEAFQVADKTLKVMWEDLNGEIEFSVPSGRFCDLAAGDCYGLSLRGGLYRIRITEVMETPWQLKIKARRDRQSAYTSNLTNLPLPGPTPPPASSPGTTTFTLLNIPPLRAEDDTLGIYIAATGQTGKAWQGVNVAYSVDGGASYTDAGNYTLRSVMGTLSADLAAAPAPFTDRANTVGVTLVQDDNLESLTDAEFHNEGNPCAVVFSDYSAELLQFKDATDTGDKTWTLSTLKRGRLGTTPGPHLSGATFVYLDTLNFVPLPASLVGRTFKVRVTTLGTSPETAPVVDFTFSPPRSQYELAPVFAEATYEGGIITAEWMLRHKLGTELAPVASANFAGTRVTISDGTTTNLVDTTDTTLSLPYAYLTGSPVTLSIAQRNRYYGTGEAAAVSLDVGAAGAVDVINGDFESGNTGWAEAADNIAGTFTITNDATKAQAGDWLAIYAGGASFSGARSRFVNARQALPTGIVTFEGAAKIPGLTASSPVVVVYPYMDAFDLDGQLILRWAAPGIVGRFGVSGSSWATSSRTVDLYLYRNQVAYVEFGYEVYHANAGTADFEAYLDDFSVDMTGRII